jgi:hypothetical protein
MQEEMAWTAMAASVLGGAVLVLWSANSKLPSFLAYLLVPRNDLQSTALELWIEQKSLISEVFYHSLLINFYFLNA